MSPIRSGANLYTGVWKLIFLYGFLYAGISLMGYSFGDRGFSFITFDLLLNFWEILTEAINSLIKNEL